MRAGGSHHQRTMMGDQWDKREPGRDQERNSRVTAYTGIFAPTRASSSSKVSRPTSADTTAFRECEARGVAAKSSRRHGGSVGTLQKTTECQAENESCV